MGAELFYPKWRTYGRTDMTKLRVAFRNFANARKKLHPPRLVSVIPADVNAQLQEASYTTCNCHLCSDDSHTWVNRKTSRRIKLLEMFQLLKGARFLWKLCHRGHKYDLVLRRISTMRLQTPQGGFILSVCTRYLKTRQEKSVVNLTAVWTGNVLHFTAPLRLVRNAFLCFDKSLL